jgi:superfamily II DNA or RNA helicase
VSKHRPRFAVGDKVQYRTDRSKVGEIIKKPVETQGFFFYHVRLFTGAREHVPEEDLEPFRAAQDPRGLFAEGRFGGPDDLIRKVTFHKLDQPLQNTLYSLGASRTDFYPHQYKPLLKFIDSDDHRLLIADEVGLGKTIEAGLVMVELRARKQLGQVVITCPAALVQKWRHEMWSRFDEDFTILNSVDFRELMRTYTERGETGELRAIISLQSLRQRGNRELLEATPLPLDLLIVDEAHHLRNPGTLSHRTIDALAVGAGAILFLTATPIHLGSDNLFHLLRILNPGEFSDILAFDQRLDANAPIVEAERLARTTPLPREEILQRLEVAARGPHRGFFAENPFHRRSIELLNDRGELHSSQRVELESHLKDLNLFSHVITRTRKREVFERSAVRKPHVVSRTPTEAERTFYNAVTAFVRDLHDDGTGSVFAAITAQRQVASCMQAAKSAFKELAGRSLADPESSDLDLDLWNEWGQALADEERELSYPERVIFAADALGTVDTKFDALLEQLQALEEEEPDRKVLVFAYFKPTLRYLESRLSAEGIRCARIDGDVHTHPTDPDKDERGRVMKQFKDDPTLRVLLSSEVGSEGLDFQFCHVLINYDLPWNPMRVEQRIGRVDRLGQEADRIIIINLSLTGTIEDRILHRLYERIGIFEQSIGDMEAILGEEIERLTRELLSRRLSPDEEDRRIEETARVLETRKRELDRLDREGDRFVGRDFFFDEQLERARKGGEILASTDLRLFVEQFLDRVYPHSRVAAGARKNEVVLEIDPTLESDLRSLQDPRPLRLRFLQRISRGKGKVRATFRSKTAFGDPDLEFVAPHHPLCELAVSHYRDHGEELHPTAALEVVDAGVPAGRYVYLLHQITTRTGPHGDADQRHRLEPFFVHEETDEPLERQQASLLFGAMLRGGEKHVVKAWDCRVAAELIEVLEDRFVARLAEDTVALRERQAARVNTRRITLEASFRRKVERKKELLSEARSSGKPDNYLRLLDGTIRNLEAEFHQRASDIEAEADVHVTSSLIASGVVVVRPE